MRFAMKVPGIVVLLMIIFVLLFSAGCLSTQPAPQAVPSGTTAPTVTGQPSIAVTTTPAPVSVITPPPEITPVQALAYVKRPYGFVQYSYNPGYQAVLQDSHLETDPATGEQTIVGTIKNIGSETIDLVVVTADLYSSEGNAIGSISAEMNYLQPNKIWKFRAGPFSNPDYSYYKIMEVFTG
jgi:hypothetical protein